MIENQYEKRLKSLAFTVALPTPLGSIDGNPFTNLVGLAYRFAKIGKRNSCYYYMGKEAGFFNGENIANNTGLLISSII